MLGAGKEHSASGKGGGISWPAERQPHLLKTDSGRYRVPLDAGLLPYPSVMCMATFMLPSPYLIS
jgi:hypothetical protein